MNAVNQNAFIRARFSSVREKKGKREEGETLHATHLWHQSSPNRAGIIGHRARCMKRYDTSFLSFSFSLFPLLS